MKVKCYENEYEMSPAGNIRLASTDIMLNIEFTRVGFYTVRVYWS